MTGHLPSSDIPFNRPFLTGKELMYIQQAVESGKISGNGMFTQKCQQLLESRFGFSKTLLTTSCTDALEMAALLADIQPGDEVIVPSYTFVSSALAFVRQGAKIIFADSMAGHPNMDADTLPGLITPRTKVIVPVHYAGVACDMQKIMQLAGQHHLLVIEDAAQAIDATYQGRPLGGIGHLGTYSFHETKNVICGEGGALLVNHPEYARRAEIIWEKGTNRAEFFRGEVNKYGWVDTGSSFLPSEIVSAFLYAQLEQIDKIQRKRLQLWNTYFDALRPLETAGKLHLPSIPGDASNNAHMFYILCHSLSEREALRQYLKEQGILAVFHYLPLHKSEFYAHLHDGRDLPYADTFADCLLRLPLFYELTLEQINRICTTVNRFYHA